MTTTPRQRVAVTVAVCTFRRNEALSALIRRIDAIAACEPPATAVRVLVVDDSPERAARATVENLRGDVALEITYDASASADISVARNRALALGGAATDFVACLDDDCIPHDGWLRELLRVAHECAADIVVGHRQFVAASGAPRWLSEQPFLAENLVYPDGTVPTRGNTANMLVSAAWFNGTGIRFRTAMGKVGGEDMVFFNDATDGGANIRFAAGSICDEPCDGRRATFRYQAWRQMWLGNNQAAINRQTHEASNGRLVARGLRRIVSGALHPFVRLVRRKSPQWRWAVALTGNGVGLLLGLAGLHIRHRS